MKYCPNSKCAFRESNSRTAEYMDNIVHCADCGALLVTQKPHFDEAAAPTTYSHLASFGALSEALRIYAELEKRGLSCRLEENPSIVPPFGSKYEVLVDSDHIEAAREILITEPPSDPLLDPRQPPPEEHPELGWTVLLWAARWGNLATLRECLASGRDVDQRGYNGKAALHLAVEYGHDEIVRELLRAGANIDLEDDEGNTALILACGLKETSIVPDLLSAGADVSVQNSAGMRPLDLAFRNHRADLVKSLLLAGAESGQADHRAIYSALLAVRESPLVDGRSITIHDLTARLKAQSETKDEWIGGLGLGGLFSALGKEAGRRIKEHWQNQRDEWAQSLLLAALTIGVEVKFSLFLRAFQLSRKTRFRNPASSSVAIDLAFHSEPRKLTLEALLSRSVSTSKPLVALGFPGETDVGGRIPTADDNWQYAFAQLAQCAVAIFLVPANRTSVKWEVQWLVERNMLSKVLFVMPPEIDSWTTSIQMEWIEAKEAFREMGLDLPSYNGKGMLIRLSRAGEMRTTPLPLFDAEALAVTIDSLLVN